MTTELNDLIADMKRQINELSDALKREQERSSKLQNNRIYLLSHIVDLEAQVSCMTAEISATRRRGEGVF